MAAIRRSGGVVALFWSGNLPDPESPDFTAALADRRFRTIEDAASEEVSVGWVTPGDPTGDSFDLEDMQAGAGFWLRMRVDRKKLPTKWLAIHREAAEKLRGKRLSARERKEMREDLMSKLLPRVLPTVQMVDALVLPQRRTVLLFATGKGHIESFDKLFFSTFTLPLAEGDPYELAQRAGLGDDMLAALDRVQPVAWPQAEGEAQRRPARPAAAAAAHATDDDEVHTIGTGEIA